MDNISINLQGLDSVIISAVQVVQIIAFAEALKKILESKLFKWLLKLFGYDEVVPYLAVIITVIVGIITGLNQYGQDGITWMEIITILGEIVFANSTFYLLFQKGKK